MKLEDKKWGRNLMYVATIAGALFGIFKFGEYCYEKWEAYQATVDNRIEAIVDARVNNIIIENPKVLMDEIVIHLDGRYDDGPRIDKLEQFIYSKFDSIDKFHDSKFKYYSIGLRGDGSNKVWYRNRMGDIYRAHFSEVQGWYHISDDGSIINIQ